ncbi:hypothetical protein UNDYM_3914 [Undibacterium sp. YM2]|uniref:hypothetical protein n=1 Tax=Undibacterium sp. YM2 TaxID=2058625 RepID=UPI001331CD78|nr:hypothetical protein [Undibacterium sp. YM2]BBB68167.1 hypothetical protein UNDYM_3914 [Undibacterium sp. YM2]
MNKKLKKRVLDQFAACMQKELQAFSLFKGSSDYFFDTEKVWEDSSTVAGVNLYVIFTPEFNGRDQFTIEIGWSRLQRFPQLVRRPSLSFSSEFTLCSDAQEATARLPKIMSLELDSWVEVNKDNVEEVVSTQFKNLMAYGMPFLKENCLPH